MTDDATLQARIYEATVRLVELDVHLRIDGFVAHLARLEREWEMGPQTANMADGRMFGYKAYDPTGESHYVEVLEHWAVSDWLGEKLEDVGEVVERNFHGACVWCRTGSTKQNDGGLTHDSALQRIAREQLLQ